MNNALYYEHCIHNSVSFAAGKMASGRGRSKDGTVTEEQLKELEIELQRNRTIEQNEKRMAALRLCQKSAALKEICEESQPPKKPKKKKGT